MDRSRIRKLSAFGGAVAVAGLALALAGPSIGSAPPDDGSSLSCVDFARDVDPKQVEVDTGYDAENDVVYAHTDGRTYVLRPSDPACRSLTGVRAVMDDAVQTDRDNEVVGCRDVEDTIREGRTEVRGRTFDREAAERFVTERCGSDG
ncbi:MAG: hypothetical protein ACRDKG_06720 [Actinomycetota bacterium]